MLIFWGTHTVPVPVLVGPSLSCACVPVLAPPLPFNMVSRGCMPPVSLVSVIRVAMGAVVARPQQEGEGADADGGEVSEGAGQGERRSVKFEGDDMDEEADRKQARGCARRGLGVGALTIACAVGGGQGAAGRGAAEEEGGGRGCGAEGAAAGRQEEGGGCKGGGGCAARVPV
jgi:hypothetical protein